MKSTEVRRGESRNDPSNPLKVVKSETRQNGQRMMKRAHSNSYNSIKVRKPHNNIASIASISIKKVPSIEVEIGLVKQI
jgi:hypothetical protein